ncbi:MAG: hypothetical protein EPN33_11450 [Acidobacteria bacterium]|nr:MAG: hypothetical protein EPN33_11450 [Acidobacteriota bacterium]
MLAAILLLGLFPAMPQAPAAPPAPSGLTAVKRIYVEPFGKDAQSQAIQSMVISTLVASGRFIVTENRGRADAVLQGQAIERTSQQLHTYQSATRVGRLASNDRTADTETDSHAAVSVRLVAKDGDILWSTTQESNGGKYEGAGASAADACVKQLLHDAGPLPVPH